jgi:hypothetical protein
MTDKVEMSDSEKKKEDWMNAKWRPMMGWMYMVVCTMDMVIFPILWSLLQTLTHSPITQWNPLTLQGAGLFHIAMGAVLGLAAWGRTQEKLGGANNGGLQSMAPSSPTTFGSAPTGGFGASPTPGFGAPSAPSGFGGGGFGSTPKTAATFGAPSAPAMSSSGKPMPVQPDQPEL